MLVEEPIPLHYIAVKDYPLPLTNMDAAEDQFSPSSVVRSTAVVADDDNQLRCRGTDGYGSICMLVLEEFASCECWVTPSAPPTAWTTGDVALFAVLQLRQVTFCQRLTRSRNFSVSLSLSFLDPIVKAAV